MPPPLKDEPEDASIKALRGSTPLWYHSHSERMRVGMSLIRLWTLVGLLGILPLSLHILASTANAQPEISDSDPQDGALLDAPPEIIQVCFTEPVVSEGVQDYNLVVVAPGSQPLGLRILFKQEGDCAEIHPGRPEGEIAGLWEVQWQVTSRASGEIGSGSFRFRVSPPPTPIPTPTPDVPNPTGGDGGDVDILLLALIITGGGVGAVVLGLFVYLRLLRKRFWFQR
ncbi:MAG: copper resistance protein CopC [Euryarchaeota archaeon]|nr:copper resistance protein CopC [Euryarchaeota archaeon]